jgi:hypothetical protein
MAIAYCWEDHQNLQQQIHYARTKWRLMYLGGDIGCGLTGFGWIWWCELNCRILVRFGKAKICRAGQDMRNGKFHNGYNFPKLFRIFLAKQFELVLFQWLQPKCIGLWFGIIHPKMKNPILASSSQFHVLRTKCQHLSLKNTST